MRKKFLPSLLLILLVGILTGCNNDSNDSGLDSKQRILLSKYPLAQNLTWSKSTDNKYDIAKFTLPKTRAAVTNDTVSVWFGASNSMRLIKEAISFSELSAEIKASFAKAICRPVNGVSDQSLLNTRYSDGSIWEVDDVYLLEKDGAISYRIEMETVSSRNAEVEMVLIYDVQGILLNEYEAADDDDYPLEVPEYILNWIAEFFPGSEIIDYEYDMDDNEIEHELDLKLGQIIIEVELEEVGGVLIVTELEYNYPNLDALPVAVKDLAVEIIGTLDIFTITDVCEIEMEVSEAGIEEYEIELRNANKEYEICIIRDKEGMVSRK